MLSALAVIALVALGVIPLLAALLQSRRRRPASTQTTHQPGPNPDTTTPRTPPPPHGGHSNGTVAHPPAPDPVRVEQVKALQRRLAALGFDPGPIDGHYGPQTTDAVKHLQHHNAFKPDGIVGPLTARLLAPNAPPANDRAQSVKALQHQLDWLGYHPGRADGHYGPQTTQAVKRFQQTHHLPIDGVVDHTTASTLKATITQRPSTHRTDRVKTLQHQLQTLGHKPGPIDGRYGPQTTQAVKHFQHTHHLPATGIVDPHTHNALQHILQKPAHT